MSNDLLCGFDSLDYWRLCDSLSVSQAALLMIGEDPSGENMYIENWDPDKRPIGYEAAKSAVGGALKLGAIEGELIPVMLYDINNNPCDEVTGSVSPLDSTVHVNSLKDWLRLRGFNKGFFFPEPVEVTSYLEPAHPKYAPKLAAAIRAWEAVDLDGSRSAKERLMVWLRKHASEYGLVNDDGNPYESAIEEIAKVANWAQGGGAPKTPS